MKLSGWGNYPRVECRLLEFHDAAALRQLVAADFPLILRGNGRAYGDAALNPHATISALRFNRLLDFDVSSGKLRCEAGVLLQDVLDVFVPRGWFSPVTPGTQFITVGGMLAANVHGKNHHRSGGFAQFVEAFDILHANGRIDTVTRASTPALFEATAGGMGLTGAILRVAFRLIPIETAFIRQETLPASNLLEVMGLFEDSRDWTYTVAWIDCLARGAKRGRSVLYRGEHATRGELPVGLASRPLECPTRSTRRVPFYFPQSMLNSWTVSTFNTLFYAKARAAAGESLVDFRTFFFPLDSLHNWNRIYGFRGFTQYQCVLPKSESERGLSRLLEVISASGWGSFLAVLKLMGPGSGPLTFPLEGYTLALDFPWRPGVNALLDKLDRIVLDHGGRLYLAKDSRASAQTVAAGYPGLHGFKSLRESSGAKDKFESLLSQRLCL